jgi:hypothetical protein
MAKRSEVEHTMTAIRCFLMQPTGEYARWLRRFSEEGLKCKTSILGYHNAEHPIEVVRSNGGPPKSGDVWDHGDPRWPQLCDCGHVFDEDDFHQVLYRTLYRREDTGNVYTIFDAPVGAMWYVDWVPKDDHGFDGHSIVLKTPGGDAWLDKVQEDGTKLGRTGRAPLVGVEGQLKAGYDSKKKDYRWKGWLVDGLLITAED